MISLISIFSSPTAFEIKGDFSSKGKFLVLFSRFLHGMYAKGKKVLLIIDEAQRLSPSMLEEIRLLSNIERPETKLINIFFVGQVEFNANLLQPENRALRQRITVNFDIPPLSLSETADYLDHRLKIAGASHFLFSAEAVQQIYLFSGGYPRLINVIADRSLLTGFVREALEIGAGVVKECARELKIFAPKAAGRKEVPAQKALAGEKEAQTGPPKGEESTEVAEAAAVSEKEGDIPQSGKGEIRETDASSLGRSRKSRRSGTLFPILLSLVLLAVVAGGIGFFVFPDRLQGMMDEVQRRVVSIAEKQSWFPFHGPGKRVEAPALEAKAGPTAVKPVEPGPASPQPAPAVAVENKAGKRRTTADKTALGRRRARIRAADEGRQWPCHRCPFPLRKMSRQWQRKAVAGRGVE